MKQGDHRRSMQQLYAMPGHLIRRAKRLRLTGEGEALLERVEGPVRRVQERLLAPLSGQDRATLVRLLAELADLHAPARSEAEG